jgi:hypothetical protein
MNRPGPVPAAAPPGTGTRVWRVVLRLVLAAVPPLTVGILAWVPLLWLAIRGRRAADWVRCGVATAMSCAGFVLVDYTDNENDWQTDVGALLLISAAAAAALYVLVADLRWREPTAPGPVPVLTPVPLPWPPPAAVPAPAPAPVGSRIDQVRVELDELSDYLRAERETQ